MKRNLLKTIKHLEIDEGIAPLIKQMWKHNYLTFHSCDGKNNNDETYLSFKENTGDGWFEKNAEKYGFKKVENKHCCYINNIISIKDKNINNYCRFCGAGVNFNIVYRRLGIFVNT